jgi:hypothetical protein
MQKIGFLIAEAGKRRLRLIIAFLDFWAYRRPQPVRGLHVGAGDVLRRAATRTIG